MHKLQSLTHSRYFYLQIGLCSELTHTWSSVCGSGWSVKLLLLELSTAGVCRCVCCVFAAGGCVLPRKEQNIRTASSELCVCCFRGSKSVSWLLHLIQFMWKLETEADETSAAAVSTLLIRFPGVGCTSYS